MCFNLQYCCTYGWVSEVSGGVDVGVVGRHGSGGVTDMGVMA